MSFSGPYFLIWDLVDHSAVCILHLEAHVSSVKCAYLVGWRHIIQHDYLQYLFLLYIHLLLLLLKFLPPKINVH